jgi:hypothetical protein
MKSVRGAFSINKKSSVANRTECRGETTTARASSMVPCGTPLVREIQARRRAGSTMILIPIGIFRYLENSRAGVSVAGPLVRL